MSRRTLIILAAIGLVMAAVLLLTRGDFGSGRDEGRLHAPGLAERLGELESLRLVHAGNEVVATIARGEKGWGVVEKDGHSADFERLRGVLDALARARRVERKTALPELYARLGVEDPETPDAGGYLLELDYGQRHAPEAYIVGRRAGSGMAYIRTAGEAQSWMVSAEFDLSDATRDWVDRDIIDLASSEVRRVVLDRGGDRLEIAKNDADDVNFTPEGIPEGRELSYGSVANSIASALSNVQVNDVRSASEVKALPVAVLANYETLDGLELTLDVREEAPVATEGGGEDGGQADSRYWAMFSAAAPASDAGDAAEASGAPAGQEGGQGDGEPAQDAPGPAERAAQLNAKLAGWAYELPQYKSDQWFKTMDDLLKDE